jgi:hypothetical protein
MADAGADASNRAQYRGHPIFRHSEYVSFCSVLRKAADNPIDAQARYESSRCFDADEDLEFNPCLTSEEYNACLAESSLSARSGRSEANSPPQSQTLPHSGIGANAYAQQAQVVHQQHQGFAGQAANGRGRKRNPIHIVDPRALQQQQASTGQWR